MSKGQSLTSISSASDSIYARQPQYTPDFTIRALENTQYLKIARSHYIAARRATLMERQPKTPDLDGATDEDVFSKEWKRAISVQEGNHVTDSDSVKMSPSLRHPGRSRTATQDSSAAGSIGSAADTPDTPLMNNSPPPPPTS